MGEKTAFVTASDGDTVVAFTNEGAAQSYVEHHVNQGGLRAGSAHINAVASLWQGHVFGLAHDMESALLIDPLPGGEEAGLRLDRAGLEAAIAWLDGHLVPRIQGFIDADEG